MMKKMLLATVMVACSLVAMSQAKGYVCVYQEKMSLPEETLSGMGNADMVAAVKQAMSQRKIFYTLTFANGVSLFERNEALSEDPFAVQTGGTVYADYNTNSKVQQVNYLGRDFLVVEDLPAYNWSITGETRQIAGRTCTKAVVDDPADSSAMSVTAWFSAETPIPAGPMGYWGLPGLIVQLDAGPMSYVLTDIKAVDKPKAVKAPSKGKKMTRQEFDEMMQKKMKEMGIDMRGGSGIRVITM